MTHDSDPQSKNNVSPAPKNEGEGSRTATREYDKGAEKAATDPAKTARLAEEAEKALEGDEGDALREAEAQGKRGPKT